MSKYYDINKPYSIENWNTLIRDVNEILENPPIVADNCPPVEPIEEVEDPHIWAVKDVEEMRDKLKETCPDISFEEELVLWKQAIIDEIEKQMEEAWCDCKSEPEDEDVVLCSFSVTDLEAGLSAAKCCGQVIADSPTFCGLSHESSWSGPWYPSPGPDNIPLYNTICDTYNTAYFATFEFIGFVNKLTETADFIEDYQDEVDKYATQVDALIAQHEEECGDPSNQPAHCPTLRQKLCDAGRKAREWQDKVDEKVIEFAEWYAKVMEKMEEANTAAATNSASAMSLQGRFPTDHNAMSECYGESVPKWSWWDWWDPKHMPKIGDGVDYGHNVPSLPGTGVLPAVSGYRLNSLQGATHLSNGYFRLSPDGTWYVAGLVAKNYNRDYTNTYQTKGDRFRCTALPGLFCDGTIASCDWFPWEYQTWRWEQGWPNTGSCVGSCLGFACWIWQPLPNPLPSYYYYSDEWHMRTQRLGGMQDNSVARDEWLYLYNNWYEENPQYDDRHEDYC